MKGLLMDRRELLFAPLAFSSNPIGSQGMASALRFAHRQANMVTSPDQDVFELASQILELSGVQLQMIWKGEDLSERDSALVYKGQAIVARLRCHPSPAFGSQEKRFSI